MTRHWMKFTGSRWTTCIGFVLLINCLGGLYFFSFVYKKILLKELSLMDGTMATKIWTDFPIPLREKIYFFNITNADQFLRQEEPLNITEVGPYTYLGNWVKKDHFWNPNNTVSYRETRTYHFVPEESVGTQDDVINTLNGPMIIAAGILKSYNIVERAFISGYLKLEGESIIIQKSIRQLVYEGYEDPIISMAPLLNSAIPYKDGTFSWLYGKNATDDGVFTVFTGAGNASQKNIINNWNGAETLKFWKTEDCNKIRGTSVEVGPPLEDNPGHYTFFQSIFCRPLSLHYTGDHTHYGVSMKRFEPDEMLFSNKSVNPDNACYEVVKERPSGILDISPCQFGSPVLISFPHFYMADPIYLKDINGLSPNSNHSSHLDVEPITGFSAHVSIKLQVNVEMEQVSGVFQFNGVPEGIFPIFWLDLNIEITESWAHLLKAQLNNPKIIGYTALVVLTLISLILIISSIIVKRRYGKTELIKYNNVQTSPSYINSAYVQDYGGIYDNTTMQTDSSLQKNETNK